MAVLGICHICSRPAIGTCFQCGRPTCVVHLDPARKVCDACRGGKRADPILKR